LSLFVQKERLCRRIAVQDAECPLKGSEVVQYRRDSLANPGLNTQMWSSKIDKGEAFEAFAKVMAADQDVVDMP
jgi:hypothetical protein